MVHNFSTISIDLSNPSTLVVDVCIRTFSGGRFTSPLIPPPLDPLSDNLQKTRKNTHESQKDASYACFSDSPISFVGHFCIFLVFYSVYEHI